MLSCKSDGCTVQITYAAELVRIQIQRLTMYPKLSFGFNIALKKSNIRFLQNAKSCTRISAQPDLKASIGHWRLRKINMTQRDFSLLSIVVIITFNEPTKTTRIKILYRKISTFQSSKVLRQILQTQTVAFHQNLGILCLILGNMNSA